MDEQDLQVGTKERVVSLDTLRGFAMFWIIGGDKVFKSLSEVWENPITRTIQQQLTHVKWEGFHFEDLIFPLFLFTVGTVLPFSILHRKKRGDNLVKLNLHIIRRTVILILLGLIMGGLLKFDWPNMRWPGVLQRIGLCYFFAALLVLYAGWRTQALFLGLILLSYWAALMLVPVPGYGSGSLNPDGCLASYIDRLLIPGKFCCYEYGDNEGILSTFPAICTVLSGVLAGHWLRSDRTVGRKAFGIAIAGIACIVAGYIWGFSFPIIKNIWTSSYVLYSGGWSLLLLALFYWLIDAKGYKRWTFFFVVIGINAITIYFLQKPIDFKAIAMFFVQGIVEHSGVFAPIIVSLSTLAVKWLFLWFLYRNRLFLKI